MEPWLQLVVQLGLPSALVIWFTWQTGEREAKLRTELNEVQKYIREEMSERIDESTKALVANAQVVAANTQVMQRIERRMGDPSQEAQTYDARRRPDAAP